MGIIKIFEVKYHQQLYIKYFENSSKIFRKNINNNYITMEEYINYMKNNDNKTKEHLSLVLNQLNTRTKDLLFKLALLNNQRIPKW